LGKNDFDKRVSIVLPALNEEETVGRVIDEIPKDELERRGLGVQVVVVDNNSTDGTKEVAQQKGATVIVEPNRGKGRAVRAAFRSIDGDFVFMLDADYTYPATYVPAMLDLLEDGWDVVRGSRLKGQIEAGAMSRLNLVGNHVLVFMARALYGAEISDLCTGLWGFRREVVESLKLNSIGFELEADIFAEVTKRRYRVAEIPIRYRPRPTPSTHGSWRIGFRIGRTLIMRRFR